MYALPSKKVYSLTPFLSRKSCYSVFGKKNKIKFYIIKGTLTTQQTIQIRSNFAHKIKFGKTCSDNLLNLHAFRVMVIGGEKIMYKSNWGIIYCNFSPFLTDSYSHSMPVLQFHLKTIFTLSHSYY